MSKENIQNLALTLFPESNTGSSTRLKQKHDVENIKDETGIWSSLGFASVGHFCQITKLLTLIIMRWKAEAQIGTKDKSNFCARFHLLQGFTAQVQNMQHA